VAVLTAVGMVLVEFKGMRKLERGLAQE
jgi:hypothetical protein